MSKSDQIRCRVLLPLPLSGAYDYLAPEASERCPEPGAFVRVPLGSRELTGVVWDPAPAGAAGVSPERLRRIAESLAAPPLPERLRRFVDWVSAYTMAPPGAVLRMVMSAPGALAPPRPATAYARAEGISSPHVGSPGALADGGRIRLTPARRRVLAFLEGAPPLPAPVIAAKTGVGVGVVKGLAQTGLIVARTEVVEPNFAMPRPDAAAVARSPRQEEAARALREAVAARAFNTLLLDGVTGSGKTAVYFEAIAACLGQGRQSLVLLPEIALSAQWLERFEMRFGVRPAVWHSDLSQAERRLTWRAVAQGRAPVLVGARSALFLPFPDLGAIIVDEEHDAAFRQEEGVRYHARDMAVVRGQLSGIPVILASATPALETIVNVDRGRYRHLRLPDRFGGATLPDIDAVDLRRDPPERGKWLAPPVVEALTEALAAGAQAMLFLNRRGYAPLTLCRACGHRLQCPNCTAWLVEHRLAGRLQCHHCGYRTRIPDNCPSCGAFGAMTPCGPGVERLAEEVTARFPDARCVAVTSDTVAGPSDAAGILRAVVNRDVDLVIGTQIVAKGHHFPALTFVGVVDADLGLSGGDLRAAERTHQLLHQVAGRAGRADLPGRVLLQTHQPEHPVIRSLLLGERDAFLRREIEDRQHTGMPPFGRLAAIVVTGPDSAVVDSLCRSLARKAPPDNPASGFAILGPAPAPLALLRGRHRRRFLVKASRATPLQEILANWLGRIRPPGTTRIQIDIDPYSFQ